MPEVQEHFSKKVTQYVNTKKRSLHIDGLITERILEVGCGAKFTFENAEEKYGIDITPELLREMKRQNADVNVILADARYLPFKQGVFSAVVAIFVLHHLVTETASICRLNAQRSMFEMSRTLSNAGSLVILEHVSQNKLFSYVMYYVTLIFAKANLDFDFLDIHEKVITYYFDKSALEKMGVVAGLQPHIVQSKYWQFRNFRLGCDNLYNFKRT